MKGISKDDIVFLGDSLTEWFDYASYFGNHAIVNRGIAGDTTDGVLYRLEEITNAQPRAIFLMIGINDIFHGNGIDIISRNQKAIIDLILEKSGRSKLFVQSVLPVNESFFAITDNINHKVAELNEKLKSFCEMRGVSYIDLHSHFLKDGEMDETYTYDGGHLTAEGYDRWAELIRELVNNYITP